MRKTSITAAAMVAIFGAACAANNDPYTALDTDADTRLNQAEFATGARDAGYFVEWDTDRDRRLNQSELREGYMRAGVQTSYWADVWDLNEDGYLSEEELYEGHFQELDRNDDDYLDRAEYEAGIVQPMR